MWLHGKKVKREFVVYILLHVVYIYIYIYMSLSLEWQIPSTRLEREIRCGSSSLPKFFLGPSYYYYTTCAEQKVFSAFPLAFSSFFISLPAQKYSSFCFSSRLAAFSKTKDQTNNQFQLLLSIYTAAVPYIEILFASSCYVLFLKPNMFEVARNKIFYNVIKQNNSVSLCGYAKFTNVNRSSEEVCKKINARTYIWYHHHHYHRHFYFLHTISHSFQHQSFLRGGILLSTYKHIYRYVWTKLRSFILPPTEYLLSPCRVSSIEQNESLLEPKIRKWVVRTRRSLMMICVCV